MDGDSEKMSNLKTEIFKKNLQLDTWNQIIDKYSSELKAKNEICNAKFDGLLSASLTFIKEQEAFNETYGILSPWWHQQMQAIQDPGISQVGAKFQHLQEENAKMESEIEKLEKEIRDMRLEVANLKLKKDKDDALIIQLRIEEDALRREPFGEAFLRLKSEVQAKKEQALKVQTLLRSRSSISRTTTTPAGRREAAQSQHILFQNMALPSTRVPANAMTRYGTERKPKETAGFSGGRKETKGGYEVYKILKRTRVTFKQQRTNESDSPHTFNSGHHEEDSYGDTANS